MCLGSVNGTEEEQMPENTQRVSVGGFSFENKDEAEQAKKEIEGIRYIKTKTDMNDPEVILQVYNKMIGQKLFETAVGYSYLKDLQEYLTTIPFIKNEDILPIPVTHPRLEESLKKQKREIAQKERVRACGFHSDRSHSYKSFPECQKKVARAHLHGNRQAPPVFRLIPPYAQVKQAVLQICQKKNFCHSAALCF